MRDKRISFAREPDARGRLRNEKPEDLHPRVLKVVCPASGDYALKLEPQPQELVALGLLKTNPRPMISSLKSITVPLRYR